ncbi:MAG TPA: hypothetical protein VGH97_10430, partial [Thermoanaerobaculia bacterium]
GTRLAFTKGPVNQEDILVKDLTSSEPAAPLPGGVGKTTGARDIPENWTGDSLIFMTLADQRTFWTLRMDGKSEPERLMAGAGQFTIDEPHVSPDGRWLAFVSTESGRFEVYVVPFRRKGEMLRVSTNGGGQPRWRRDGKELFYLSSELKIMAVEVNLAKTPELSAPRALFPVRIVQNGIGTDEFVVSPDGQRFLATAATTSTVAQPLTVVLNWQEDARKK